MEPLMFCSGICLLCEWVQAILHFLFLLDLLYLVLCWNLLSTWTYVLCMVTDIDLFAFYIQTSICWRYFLFSIVWFFSFFVKNPSVHRCVGLFQGLWFDSIDQHVCSYTNTMQCLLLFCGTAWGQGWMTLLLFRIVSAILGFLFFHRKLRILRSMFIKNCVGIFMGIALNL